MSDQVLSQAEIDAMIAEAPPPEPAAAAVAVAPAPAPAPQPIVAAAPEAEPPATPLPPRPTGSPMPQPEVWSPPSSAADAPTPERGARPAMRVAHAPVREPGPEATLAPPSPSNSALRDALDRIGQMEIDVDQLRRSRTKVRQLDRELQSLHARVDELEQRLASPKRARASGRRSLWSAGFYVDHSASGSWMRGGG